jgi:hypothetical protein
MQQHKITKNNVESNENEMKNKEVEESMRVVRR